MVIRGEGMGLSWEKGRPLTQTTKDTWETTLNFNTSQDTYRCQKTLRLGLCNKLEFRIRTGKDKRDMLGANFVFSLPISASTLAFKDPPSVTVFPWFFRQEGEVTKENVFSPELGENRTIQV